MTKHPSNNETPHKNGVDMRGLLSLATLLVSMGALTLSMGGAAKLVIDVFKEGINNSLDGLLIKAVVLGFAFLFGWIFALTSIRAFGNLIYSIIIKVYAWVCLGAVSILYIKILEKLFKQNYDWMHFWAYLIMLLGGLFVLICLHLLIANHDLRPFAIIPLIISVLQLFLIIYRYVFTEDAKGLLVVCDFAIFITMISISALMLMHIGILSPLREWIDGLFISNGEKTE